MYKAIKLVSYHRAVGKKKESVFSANFLFAIVVIQSGLGLDFTGGSFGFYL